MFTHPFLEQLKKWHIKTWRIFEWGSGYSTVWFSRYAHHITSVEHKKKWFEAVKQYTTTLSQTNITLYNRPAEKRPHKSDGGEQCRYVQAINETDTMYDCIVIDGFHRNACAAEALKHIRSGGIIILDNAHQKSIGIDSSPTFALLAAHEHHSFLQPGYLDWRTDYWIIRKE